MLVGAIRVLPALSERSIFSSARVRGRKLKIADSTDSAVNYDW